MDYSSFNNSRLLMINRHLLNAPFKIEKDSTLSSRRSNSSLINQDLLFNSYFGSSASDVKRLRNLAVLSPNFDHLKESLQPYEIQRGNTISQILDLYVSENVTFEVDQEDPAKKLNMMYVFAEYDKGVTTRIMVHNVLYIDTLQNLGSEKHMTAIKNAYSLQEYGCFAMTELGHGSNVASLETTAVYVNETREFKINSPTPTSAKWWIGAAGKTADKAVLFAQLIVENQSRGIHAFYIPIRDHNHNPYPGVVLGDCGPKISLDRIDNGFILFKDYMVPYDSLLDRFSFITADGKFKSSIKNNDKRLAAMLGGLIRGRAAVCSSSEITLRSSLTIALRFASVRQVHILNKSSILLDNPITYTKLIPCLARLFAIRISTMKFVDLYAKNYKIYKEDPEGEELAELHSLLSSLKAVSSWMSIDCLQIVLEVCGRFAIYDNAALGRIRYNHDVNSTWEGDNTVLIQQVGKYALKQVQRTYKGSAIHSKIFSSLFMTQEEISEAKLAEIDFSKELSDTFIKCLKYKFNYLLYKSIEKLQEKSGTSANVTEAWNNTQAYYIQDLGKAYGECIMAKGLFEFCEEISKKCQNTGREVKKLADLFCVDRIIKWMSLFSDGFFSNNTGLLFKRHYLKLCKDLKDSAINIIESVAPPDKLTFSSIGNSDGQIYSALYSILSNP